MTRAAASDAIIKRVGGIMQYAAPLLLIRCVGSKTWPSGANEWHEIANINSF
jgi:hypothetical protein